MSSATISVATSSSRLPSSSRASPSAGPSKVTWTVAGPSTAISSSTGSPPGCGICTSNCPSDTSNWSTSTNGGAGSPTAVMLSTASSPKPGITSPTGLPFGFAVTCSEDRILSSATSLSTTSSGRVVVTGTISASLKPKLTCCQLLSGPSTKGWDET